MILRFGEFELDSARGELRRDGEPVDAQPRVLGLLLYLAERRDRVVPKSEILERVWEGVSVSEASLTTAINAARALVGDDGKAQGVIATVPRRGYRFSARVREVEAPSASAPSDFVGREDVIAQLWGAFERARAGEGGVELLTGDPGIGKTRAAEELSRRAGGAGGRALLGWCGEGAPPFWPWTQLLRAWAASAGSGALRALPAGVRDDVSRLARELGEPRGEALAAREPASARFRLYESVAAWLRSSAEREPLVLVFDDLQWADASSLRMLCFAARELVRARVLFVGTYRQEEIPVDHPLGAALAELARLPRHERIVLGGLTRDEVGRIVAAQTRAEPSPELVQAIHTRSEGNPFFARELARLIGANGGSHAGVPIPPAVRDVIGARLARLSAETRELLGVAALCGRDFALGRVRAVAGCSDAHAQRALHESERAGLIAGVADGAGFRFAHALVQETVAAEVGVVRRRALHRRIALALEAERARGLEPPLAELLHHWCLGASRQDAARLAEHGRRAAAAALERFAWENAAHTCRRALAALDALDASVPEARCDLLALLVQAEFSLGNGPAWHEALGQAVAVARRLGQPQRLARVAIYVGDMATGVVDRAAIALYEESLASLAPSDVALRAELLSGLACALYWSPGDGARVRALADEALELARHADDPEVLAVVLNNRHLALWGPDSLDERVATSNELVAVATRSGSRRWLHDGRHRHLLDALERGDAADARHDLAEIARLSAELRYPGWQSAPGAALLALLEGRLDDAERLAQERFERISRAGFANAAMFHATQLAAVRREQGRLGELEGGVRALVASYPNMPTWRATLAYLHCEAGRTDSARRELEALLPEDATDLPRDATWLTSVGLLAEVAARVGDAARSRRLATLLAPFAGRMIVLGPALAVMSSVARPLALAAAAAGDAAAAVAHFERALELESSFGARCLAARTRAQWAASLAHSERQGDSERARALASDALAEAETIGMRNVAAAARATLEDLTGVVRLRRRG